MAAEQLRRAAEAEGLDAARVLALDDAEPGELLRLSVESLRAYAVALVWSSERDAGRAPEGWRMVATCESCGPVLLWPGAPREVLACPWCWNRRKGQAIPMPERAAQRVPSEGLR